MGSLIRATGVMACVFLSAGVVRAQAVGGYQGQPAGAVQLFGNPGMNPYMNPYAAGLMPNNPDFLLYMYSANQAQGGFGTGVMSGTRPGPGQQMGANGQVGPNVQAGMNRPVNSNGNAPSNLNGLQSSSGNQRRARNTRAPALMPLASSVPGSGAAGFFGQGFNTAGGAARYYNRNTGRANNNGR